MKNYKVQDRETGTVIDDNLTLDEALKMIAEFEEEDKKEWIYEANFYEVK